MEQLRYISLDTKKDECSLIVQLDGGGAEIRIKRHAPAKEVIYQLRELAHALEYGIDQRNTSQPAA